MARFLREIVSKSKEENAPLAYDPEADTRAQEMWDKHVAGPSKRADVRRWRAERKKRKRPWPENQ